MPDARRTSAVSPSTTPTTTPVKHRARARLARLHGDGRGEAREHDGHRQRPSQIDRRPCIAPLCLRTSRICVEPRETARGITLRGLLRSLARHPRRTHMARRAIVASWCRRCSSSAYAVRGLDAARRRLRVAAGTRVRTRSSSFLGYACRDAECAAHKAGFAWADRQGITDPAACVEAEDAAFIEGCRAFAELDGHRGAVGLRMGARKRDRRRLLLRRCRVRGSRPAARRTWRVRTLSRSPAVAPVRRTVREGDGTPAKVAR